MSLTDREKQLIADTYAKLEAQIDEAAVVFYGRLFKVAPHTRELFKRADMRDQGMKLIQTIGLAIGGVYDLEKLAPVMQALGARHISYGVTAEQYPLIGETLIWTLENMLEDDFSPETKAAWEKVYKILTDFAIRAYEA